MSNLEGEQFLHQTRDLGFALYEERDRLITGMSNYAVEGSGKDLTDLELNYVYEYANYYLVNRGNSLFDDYISHSEIEFATVAKARQALKMTGMSDEQIKSLQEEGDYLINAAKGLINFPGEEIKSNE